MLSILTSISTCHNKESHSNLDTTDIICYYNYVEICVIALILKVNYISCFIGVRMGMIIIQCKYTTHYTYNNTIMVYTLYCCFCYYALCTSQY